MTSFENINTQLLAVNAAQDWFPAAKRYGQSLRLGSLQGEKGSSLWIDLRTGRWKDHSTGEGGRDLISLYAAIHNLLQGEAKRKLEGESYFDAVTALKAAKPPKAISSQNYDYALSLWASSIPARNTVTETYLRARGITLPIPSDIRTVLMHKHNPSGQFLPVMLAAVRQTMGGKIIAVHRTWLMPDGSAKANVKPDKMMLGPVSGGAVQLSKAAPKMVVSEGIENALSVTQATGLPAWAGLSTSGLIGLRLPVPPMAEEIIIACDNDPPGRRAADEVAEKWTKEGRKVCLALPPENKDFNDLLMETE